MRMPHPSAVGIAPKVSNARETITYTSPADTVTHITAERLGATNVRMTVGNERYFWPAGGRIRVNMSGLPEDSDDIVIAVRDHLETIDDDGYVLFPVKSVVVNREGDYVEVFGDENRLYRMRPMPR